MYYKYKYTINSVDNINDLEYIINKSNCIDEELCLLYKSTFKNFTNKYMSVNAFVTLLNNISFKIYKDEVHSLISNCQNLDYVQNKTIEKIIKNKLDKKVLSNNNNLSSKPNETIQKDCPHCGHKNISCITNDYIICGFSNMGHDNEGCGRDWCFQCNKKLCKTWYDNDLYMMSNRYHNNKCCLKYAEANNLNYETDFCMCKNNYINRQKYSIVS